MLRQWIITASVACLVAQPAYADCRRQRVCIPHKQAVVVHQKAFVAPVVAYPTYYQVGSAVREEAIAKRAAELALEAFTKALQEQGGLPGVGAPPDTARDTLAAKVQAVLTNRCARCHSGADPKGGLDLTDLSKLDDLAAHKVELLARKGKMPPPDNGGAPIPDEEAALLEEWVLSRTR